VKGKILNHHKLPSSCCCSAQLTLVQQLKTPSPVPLLSYTRNEQWNIVIMMNFLTWYLSYLCHWPPCATHHFTLYLKRL